MSKKIGFIVKTITKNTNDHTIIKWPINQEDIATINTMNFKTTTSTFHSIHILFKYIANISQDGPYSGP